MPHVMIWKYMDKFTPSPDDNTLYVATESEECQDAMIGLGAMMDINIKVGSMRTSNSNIP